MNAVMDAVMMKAPKAPKVLQARPYQDRIKNKVVKVFVDMVGKTREATAVMIESPTGSGKTIMGLMTIQEVVDNHYKIFGKKKGKVTINWCAMRRNLLAQAEVENQALFKVANVNYVSMFDPNPPECDILVFDECQHSCADSAVNIYTASKPKAVLGLSATPYRADRQKLCFHACARDAGYRQLIHEGFLAKFNQYMLPDWSVQTVVKTYLDDVARWGKSIGFFLTVAECEEAAMLVRAAGLRADVVTGNSPREEQLEAFSRGDIDILFNVYVLSEGFDCPELKTVFCRPSSKAPTIQMCGRAFRKFEDKVANVVQSLDSKYPFSRVATPEKQFVLGQDQDSWRDIKVSDAAHTRMLELRKAVLRTKVELPKAVLKAMDSKKPIRFIDGSIVGARGNIID